MNRLELVRYTGLEGKKRFDWKPSKVLSPSVLEMEDFAAQFTSDEWRRLCKNQFFLAVIDRDLVEAGAIAASILDRCVIVFRLEK